MKIYHRTTGEFITEIKNYETDFIGINLENADLTCANLENANFYNANLKNVNFYNANLENANFCNANLENADLENANLKNTNLSGTNLKIIFFKFNKHTLQKINDTIRIGCEVHDTKYWLKHGKEIGENCNYTKKEIKAYLDFIRKNK